MSIGTAIGAITFTGSIIAFAKLQGVMSGAPIVFPGQHALNALLGLLMIALVVWFCDAQTGTLFWAIAILAFIIGVLIIIPIGAQTCPL